MRTHIAKSLQTRCKTIRKAVAEYNIAATAATPSRPLLDWSKVSDYNFIEEFTLLRESHNDLGNISWSQSHNREILKLRRRILRAKEEVERCNIETRRLHTAVQDEHEHFQRVLEGLRASSDPILTAVQGFVTQRRRTNMHLLHYITRIHKLEGFTGDTTPGHRVGSIPADVLPVETTQTSPCPMSDAVVDEDGPCAARGPVGGGVPSVEHTVNEDQVPSNQEMIGGEDEDPINEEMEEDIAGLIQFFDGLTF